VHVGIFRRVLFWSGTVSNYQNPAQKEQRLVSNRIETILEKNGTIPFLELGMRNRNRSRMKHKI
jgi:hypothetical protein